MDEWNKFDEKELPVKISFYSNLMMEDISDRIINMPIMYLKNSI